MTMRKKDYQAIARAINSEISAWECSNSSDEDMECLGAERGLRDLAKVLADYCATQDPTFKRDRFLADCGVSHD